MHLRKYVGSKLPILFQLVPKAQRNFPLIFFVSNWKMSGEEETNSLAIFGQFSLFLFCFVFYPNQVSMAWKRLNKMHKLKTSARN